MSENEKELIDLDKEGKVINISDDSITSEKPKQPTIIALIIMIFITLIIILFGAIFIYLSYLRIQNFILIITENKDEANKKATEIITNFIKKKPNCSLGLDTGNTSKNIYKELIKKYQNKEISFKDITTYNIDEYIGLSRENNQSNYYYMKKNLFDHIDIKNDSFHLPDVEKDIEKGVLDFKNKIENAKIDLQLLEIGINGQIGFNEPGTLFNSSVHIVKLSENIINENLKFFNNDISKVPKEAITMGIRNILSAKNILIVANGYKKAKSIKQLVKGFVNIKWPCTSINAHKGKVYVVIDKEAASEL